MKISKAYGFFDCRASKKEIEEQLPTIREVCITPFGLELVLREGVNELTSDFLESIRAGMKFTIKASCPNISNQEIAEELHTVLSQVYQLFANEKECSGVVVYKNNGEYVLIK